MRRVSPAAGTAATVRAREGLGSRAGMSAVLAAAALFTVFLPGWAAGGIGADPWAFAYACVVFLGGEFFTGLVAILGLAAYARR